MSRSSLLQIEEQLVDDSGSVLFSFVKGEQLEFPVLMNFIENEPVIVNGAPVHPASLYSFEAVVVEALNVIDQTDKPTNIAVNPVINRLVVRVPTYRGDWLATGMYSKENVVRHDNKYWKLLIGANRINPLPPGVDGTWVETVLNKIFVQFPNSLGSTYLIKPQVNFPVYGFFELRVTEPYDVIFVRTWKPVRGMVEILFSPTDYVPDL